MTWAALFSLDAVYVFTGIVLATFAILTFADHEHPHRWGTGTFWLILAIIFAFGSLMPHWVTGVLVLLMVALDGAGQVRHHARSITRAAARSDFGDQIFLPVVLIPAVTFLLFATDSGFDELVLLLNL